ncbi:unnamed protein product [Clonostachys chloroleuca]|uniref:Uncharacterized protein n=1 Tax=Clonostachys chloroleuca TaxID=1926264 RepID=A0AA35M8C0_9HYPO|nr:unnamed protein product [Clonostachys chloroleuca]
MRFNVILIAAGLATTAVASSYNNYNYARDVESYNDEVYERDVYERDVYERDEELVANFLRSLDDDQLVAIARRNPGDAAKKAVKQVKYAGHQTKGNLKGAVSRVLPFVKFKNQVKKSGVRKPISK